MITLDRRQFLAVSGAAVLGTEMLAAPAQPSPAVPWHQRLQRVGQVNMNERDPVELDVEQWADYWADLKVDAVLVSVTGIVAFYPTAVPYHRKTPFLGDRDFFGDCCAAAKKRGLRVIGRMSPDLQWEEALEPHPEWFQRSREGAFIEHDEVPGLYRTCMYSTYYSEHMPAIMREINGRYDVDGLFTNAWPPGGSLPVCYCKVCRGRGEGQTPKDHAEYMERTLDLWKLYDGIAKEKRPDNLYYGNLGGGVRALTNLKELGALCEWFNCDNQGRGGDDSPIWGCTQQGRVARSVMKGKTTTNVTGAWSTGAVRWRNAAKNKAEADMWMAQTVASGMKIWYHWIGGQAGLGEDRRWHEPGRQFFHWMAPHDPHFVNKQTVANVGVVLGQRTNAFYDPPHQAESSRGAFSEHMQGLYYALLEGRFFFDFVHEDDLGPETLAKYAALILPNIALLSDEQCRQLTAYAASGGSLMATFETGLYDEQGRRRPEFGLGDLFGIQRAGEVQGPLGNSFYARIEQQHEILRGFDNTNWLPGAEYRVPVRAAGPLVMSVVPPYTSYPPERSYAPKAKTDEPAIVLLEKGRSRLVYFPGDVERTAWRSGNTDVSQLIQNTVRWLLRDTSPVTVKGDGVVELFAWETEPGYAVHILNYTNPNLHRGWIRKHYPIGPQIVSMEVSRGKTIRRVQLLRAGRDAQFRQVEGRVELTVPSVLDYEVAALVTA